jgi:hypothetical protein
VDVLLLMSPTGLVWTTFSQTHIGRPGMFSLQVAGSPHIRPLLYTLEIQGTVLIRPVPWSRCVFYSHWAMPKSDCASRILGRAPPFRTKDAPTLPPCVPPSLPLCRSVCPVTPGQVSPCVSRHVY